MPVGCGSSSHELNPVGDEGRSDAFADVGLDSKPDVRVYDVDALVDAPPSLWSRSYGGTARETPIGLGINSTGDVFAGMMTESPTIDLGEGPLTCDRSCIAMVSLDRDGATLWGKLFANGGAARAHTMEVDVTSSFVLAGSLFATADFGGPPLVAPGCTSEAQPDAFVARYDGDGFYLWAERFGDCGFQTVTAVRTFGTAVVVAGAFESTIDLGLGAMTSVGARDVFLAALDGGGRARWSKRFGAAGSTSVVNEIRAIAIDPKDESVYVTGSFEGAIDLGGGPLVSAGGTDVFVARYDDEGAHVWSKRFGDAVEQRGVDLVVDASGDVVVTGAMKGACDFGGGALSSAMGQGVFVTALHADGSHAWSTLFDGTDAAPVSLRAGAGSELLLTGSFGGELVMGTTTLHGDASSSSMFVAGIGSGGVASWARVFSASGGGVSGASIDVDERGIPVVLAGFGGTFAVGGASYVDHGSGDVLVAKLPRD